ncbi:hypothetical protein ROA7450_00965 [Roseovarius albus]|uniref:Uncharacterized protein n=1 Tax=Roseovarius albus TaxID=1247867 RepID=A0A1X6YKS7_9RHOB|nr:hypothetical protein [Roseovarius albus]SLN23959.1 hypothetical protein ROA7450_00965 [Roseovarius albus]
MTNLVKIDRALMGLIVVTLIATLGVYFWDKEYFSLTFAAEDKLVEYGTAVFLLISSFVLIKNAASLSAKKRLFAAGLTLFYAFLFFMAAGEEISWGQRIFGWESNEFFEANNKQFETNLHNMIIPTPFGDMHLAKTLFGSVLTTVILLYLAVLPFLYKRFEKIRNLANRLVVPVPDMRHTFFAILASLIIASIDVSRKWEVYELIFSLLTTSIFLLPQNRDKVT